jgi:hypothetical protein
MGETRNAYRILVGRLKETEDFRRPGRTPDYIKIDLYERECGLEPADSGWGLAQVSWGTWNLQVRSKAKIS